MVKIDDYHVVWHVPASKQALKKKDEPCGLGPLDYPVANATHRCTSAFKKLAFACYVKCEQSDMEKDNDRPSCYCNSLVNEPKITSIWYIWPSADAAGDV